MKTFIILSVLCLLLGQTVQLTLKELKTCSKRNELCDEESECGKEIAQKCDIKSVDAIKNNKSCQAEYEYFKNQYEELPKLIQNQGIQNSDQLKAMFDKLSPGQLKTKIDAFLSDYTKVYNDFNSQKNQENEQKMDGYIKQLVQLYQEAQETVQFPADIVKAQIECNEVCATLVSAQKTKDFQNQLIKCFGEKESQPNSNSNSNLSLVLQLTIITLAVCFLSLI